MSNKYLILMRHGDALGNYPKDDRERTLSPDGRKASREAWKFIEKLGQPDLLIHSPIRRIIETFDERPNGWNPTRKFKDVRLYNQHSTLELDKAIEFFSPITGQADPGDNLVIILGHNPAIGLYAEALSNGKLPDGIKGSYPTSTVCVFKTTVENWRDVNTQNSELVYALKGGTELLSVINSQSLAAGPLAPPAPAVR